MAYNKFTLRLFYRRVSSLYLMVQRVLYTYLIVLQVEISHFTAAFFLVVIIEYNRVSAIRLFLAKSIEFRGEGV